MAKATFTVRKYRNATAALYKATTAIETVAEANSKAINGWAQMCALGLTAGELDIETVRKDIVEAHKVEGFSDLKGTAVYVRFYALKAIHKAEALADLIEGQALMTVYRSLSKPHDGAETAPKAKGKGGNRGGKGKARAITLETALEALNSWLDEALKGDAEMARGLAQNADLALAIAKVGKLQAVITADAKATAAKAKADKATAAATKRTQAANRKAKAKAETAAAKAKAKANRPLPKGKARTTVRLAA